MEITDGVENFAIEDPPRYASSTDWRADLEISVEELDASTLNAWSIVAGIKSFDSSSSPEVLEPAIWMLSTQLQHDLCEEGKRSIPNWADLIRDGEEAGW